MDIVFRIYDNVLASGIESIFGFSIVLLQKNEEALLKLRFDDILAFLKTRLFEQYIVSISSVRRSVDNNINHPQSDDVSKMNINDAKSVRSMNGDAASTVTYRVDEFVQDALSLKITPFMLDVYAHEYDDLVKAREAHLVEVDTLRNANRNLSNKV